MSRMYLFVVCGGLAVAAAVCLYFGITLLPNIGSYVTDNYQQYAGSGDTARYACTGSPNDVAAGLAEAEDPDGQARYGKTSYLRYDDNIVTVGPDGNHPCSIRVEGLAAGYS